MRILTTPRLRLVPVTVRNALKLWRILQEPDLRTYQDLPNVNSSTFHSMVAKRPARLRPSSTGRFEWLIVRSDDRRSAIGWVSLRIAEREPNAGEIGYSILRQHRGQGLATEAVSALLCAAFNDAALARVLAYCLPANKPSRRLLTRLGFQREGTLPHGATIAGRPVDVLLHRLDRQRWAQSGKTTVMPASAYPA